MKRGYLGQGKKRFEFRSLYHNCQAPEIIIQQVVNNERQATQNAAQVVIDR